MVAIEAREEDRPTKFFEPGLENVRSAVSELRYNTYRRIAGMNEKARFGEEKTFPINAKYTAYVTLLSQDPEGRVRLKVRIEKRVESDGKTVVQNVVGGTNAVVPGDQFKYCVRSDKEALVVVFSLSETKR